MTPKQTVLFAYCLGVGILLAQLYRGGHILTFLAPYDGVGLSKNMIGSALCGGVGAGGSYALIKLLTAFFRLFVPRKRRPAAEPELVRLTLADPRSDRSNPVSDPVGDRSR